MKEQHELPGERDSSGEITHRGVIWRYNKTWWGWFTQGTVGKDERVQAWSIHALKSEIVEKTDRLLDEDGFEPANGWRV
jgi:hypothetical protein